MDDVSDPHRAALRGPTPLFARPAARVRAGEDADQADSRAPLRRRDARRDTTAADESAQAAATASGCLGATWVGGAISALKGEVHPRACLRLPLRVFRGPGGLMAEATADLATLDGARFFTEDRIVSALGPDALCAETRAEQEGDNPDGPPPKSGPAPGRIVSLRGSLVGRHAGAGWLAPPRGRDIRIRTMADFYCAGGQVRDGWILRDTAGALAQADGPSPEAWARARIRAAGGPEYCAPPLSPDTDLEGPYIGRGSSDDHADALADRLRSLMEGDFAALSRGADAACSVVLPGGRHGLGPETARVFWTGLRAALPSAAFRIDHRNAEHPSGGAPRAALRWSLYGRHDGPGRFGQASGVYLHVMGMTQAEFGPTGLRREWTMIDDCAVWTQLLLATGDV